jgi:recombination protein RecA
MHGVEQRKYVKWKYDIWKPIVPGGIRRNIPIGTPTGGVCYLDRFTTAAHPDFMEFFELFYQNGRKVVSEEILHSLTPFSLAVWYMDDGYYRRNRGRAQLSTNSFTYEENVMIKKYFEEMWGVLPNIGRSDSGTYYLWFNTKNTIKFFDIIKDHILPLFSYKIDLKRKLMWRAFSEDELRYIRENYNIEHPRLIAHKLGRSLHSIFCIAYKLGVTQPRGGIKRYEHYM